MARNPEAKLSEEAKIFAVQALACFDSPATVAKAVKDEFGITITRQSIEAYDPYKRAGRNCAAKWKAIFDETRAAFLKDTALIGISHKAVRLRSLERMFNVAETRGNIAQMQSILEQAAKEAGGSFTNKRELTGPDGGKIPLGFDGKIQVELVASQHRAQPGA